MMYIIWQEGGDQDDQIDAHDSGTFSFSLFHILFMDPFLFLFILRVPSSLLSASWDFWFNWNWDVIVFPALHNLYCLSFSLSSFCSDFVLVLQFISPHFSTVHIPHHALLFLLDGSLLNRINTEPISFLIWLSCFFFHSSFLFFLLRGSLEEEGNINGA